MVRTKYHGQKDIRTKCYWKIFYGQNGSDSMVAIFGIDYKSSEFNTYLASKSHK